MQPSPLDVTSGWWINTCWGITDSLYSDFKNLWQFLIFKKLDGPKRAVIWAPLADVIVGGPECSSYRFIKGWGLEVAVRSRGSSLSSGWCTRDSLCFGHIPSAFRGSRKYTRQPNLSVSCFWLLRLPNCENVRLVLAFHEQLGFHYSVKQHSVELGTPVMLVSFIVVFRMVALPKNFSQS